MTGLRVAALCVACIVPSLARAADCPLPLQAPSSERAHELMNEARDHGFLWRITRDGHSSYLFGTIHVGKLKWAFPGRELRRAFADTDTLALELDLSDPDTQAQMQHALANLPPLDLPEPLKSRLAHDVSQACGAADELSKMPPVMQALTLTLLDGRRDGLEPALAQEGMLSGMAHAREHPVVALETVKTQFDVLLPSDAGAATAMVKDAVDQIDRDAVRGPLRRLANDWDKGLLDDIEHYADWCDCANTPDERKQLRELNDDRNPQMADHIAALHASGKRLLAAVGSLHMTGPNALPRLLAARGFTVKRIAFSH